jgi:hypothetical protein
MDTTCPFIVLLASLSFPLQMLVWAGDDFLKSRILEKIQQVKSCLTSKYDKPVNNGIIIEDLLDFWNKYHHQNDNDN